MTTPQAGQWDITKVKLSFPLLQTFCSTLPLLMPFDAIVRSDGLKRIVWKLLQNSLGDTQSRETSVASTDLSESLSVLSRWREERSDPGRLFCWPLLIGPAVNARNL